ncbi:MAG: PPC domain-containing DNA-binding protein [Promethearchaeota archaeon]|jgi:predicted DNA-binding protein with PD1-like motif
MKYIEGKSGRIVLAKLEKDEDLIESIRKIAEETKITSGSFFVIGTLSKATFYFYKPKPNPITIQEPLEIVACSGSISRKGEETVVHGHIDVTDSEFKSMGGHLLEGSIVDAMAFVSIIEIENGNLSEIGI